MSLDTRVYEAFVVSFFKVFTVLYCFFAHSACEGLSASVQIIRTRWQEQPGVLLLMQNPA